MSFSLTVVVNKQVAKQIKAICLNLHSGHNYQIKARMAGPTGKKCSGGAFQGGASKRESQFCHPMKDIKGSC
jgi:hypothetical protein